MAERASRAAKSLDRGTGPALTRLAREFYARDTLEVANDLVGLYLVRRRSGRKLVVRIVETEAYQGPEDLAAHSARGRTARTEVMFGPPGHAYVYFIYGFWNCLNVVTREAGVPHAVLLRAGEPVLDVTDKTWGPGLLCRALDIDRGLNGADLCGEELWIGSAGDTEPVRVRRSARIGVEYARHWARRRWRFFDAGSAYLSTGKKRHLPKADLVP